MKLLQIPFTNSHLSNRYHLSITKRSYKWPLVNNLANGKWAVGIAWLALALILFMLPAVDVFAQEIISPDICNEAPNSEVCQEAARQGDVDPVSGPGGIINKAANIIAIIAGVAAVIVIIISGIIYITAGGAIAGQRAGDSPNRAKKAQSALIGALIGLVVIALAWAITRFITDRVIQ